MNQFTLEKYRSFIEAAFIESGFDSKYKRMLETLDREMARIKK